MKNKSKLIIILLVIILLVSCSFNFYAYRRNAKIEQTLKDTFHKEFLEFNCYDSSSYTEGDVEFGAYAPSLIKLARAEICGDILCQYYENSGNKTKLDSFKIHKLFSGLEYTYTFEKEKIPVILNSKEANELISNIAENIYDTESINRLLDIIYSNTSYN